VFLTHCCSGDQIKKNEMGGECSAYGDKISANRVSVGNLRERDHLGDPGVDGRMLLNGSSGSGMWGYGLDRAGLG